MTVVSPFRRANEQEILLQRGLTEQQAQPDSLEATPVPERGFFSSFITGGNLALLGAGLRRATVEFAKVLGGGLDPDFDVMQYFNEEFLAEHPTMERHFESGEVFDLPNEAAFLAFVDAEDTLNELRQQAEQASTLRGNAGLMAGQLFADAPLFLAGGLAARGTQASPQLVNWLKAGNLATRTGKAALIGGVGNLAYETALQKLDPADEPDTASMVNSLLLGSAFGAAFPLLGAALRGTSAVGARKVVNFMPQRVANGIQKQIGNAFAEKMAREARDIVAADVRLLDDLANEVPTQSRTIAPIRHPDTEPLIEKLRQSYANAGQRLEIAPAEQQDVIDGLLGMEQINQSLNGLQRTIRGLRGRFVDVLVAVTPGARLRNTPVQEYRDIYRYLFDDWIADPQSAANPLHAESVPSAESIKRLVSNLKDNVRVGIDDAYREHFKQGKGEFVAELSNGERVGVGRFLNHRAFGRVVHDYIIQQDQIRRGLREQTSFEPPEAVIKAAGLVSEYNREMLERLEDAGMLRGPKALAEKQKSLETLDERIASLENQLANEEQLFDDIEDAMDGAFDESEIILDVPQEPVDPAAFKIPFREGAKPRWGKAQLAFESDFDRAAYIVRESRGRRSKRDADYLLALTRFTGLSKTQARALGDRVAQKIEQMGISTTDEGVHRVPAGSAGRVPRPKPEEIVEELAEEIPPELQRITRKQAAQELDDLVDTIPDEVLAYRVAIQSQFDQAGVPNSTVQFPDDRLQDGAAIAISPDEWRGLGASGRLALRRNAQTRGMGVVVSEDIAEEAREIVGDRTYDKAIAELSNGSREARRQRIIEQIEENPEQFTEEQVMAARRYQFRGRSPQVKNTVAEQIEQLRIERAALADELDTIQSYVNRADTYISRRWLTDRIIRDKPRFVRLLRDQFARNRRVDFETNQTIPIEERPIIIQAIDRLDDVDRQMIADFVTEGELLETYPDLFQRYNNAVDDYFEASAESVAQTLISPDTPHGVQSAISAMKPLEARVLRIDESRFREFIDDDLHGLLDAYDDAVSGRLAIRQVIRQNKQAFQRLINEIERYDPKKARIRKIEEFDENDLMQALEDRLQQYIDAAGAVDRQIGSNLQPLFQARGNKALDVFRVGIDDLVGRSRGGVDDSTGALVGRAAMRSAMRLPFLALGGGFMLSSIPDTAAVMTLLRKPKGWHRDVGRALTPFRAFPRAFLTAIKATGDEAAASRNLANFDIDFNPLDPRLQQTRAGRIASRVDFGTGNMARYAGVLNGMNWWNRNWRRLSAKWLMYDLLKGMQSMSRAGDLVNQGLSFEEAINRVGMSREAAQRMGRLGFSAARSRRILKLIREHGEDTDGRPLRELSDEQFEKFNEAFYPRADRWGPLDREMYELYVTAMDKEIRAIIAEPGILSRPLMNRTLPGRAFNMFWSFALAWGNQTAPVAAQGTARQFVAFTSMLLGMGALTDAVKAHLSGQRSFDETGELWREQPIGMMQNAVHRSGYLSWVSRPIEVLDRFGVSLPRLFGEKQVASTLHTARAVDPVSAVGGPLVDLFDRAARGTIGLAAGDASARNFHNLRTSVPFQNNFLLQMLYRTTTDMGFDNPFGAGKGVDLLITRPIVDAQRPDRPPEP